MKSYISYLLLCILLITACTKDPPLPTKINIGPQDTALFPSQNLISNPSFELYGDSTYLGWDINIYYNVCDDFNWLYCNTLNSVRRHFEYDAPASGGNWSLILRPTYDCFNLSAPTFADWYLTGENGTAAYKLTFWTKYIGRAIFSYNIRMGVLDHSDSYHFALLEEKKLALPDTNGMTNMTNGWLMINDTIPTPNPYPYTIKTWQQYTLIDTFTLNPSDTLVVRLGSPSSWWQFYFYQAAFYDKICLTKQPLD